MKKFIAALAGTAVLLPVFAMAATFTNVQFSNGDVTVSGQGGSTVQATLHIVVPANQVVEQIETDVTGDNLAPVCTSVGGDLGLQEGTHDVTVDVKLPPNTGTYTLQVKGAGTYGGIRSIDCNDNVVGSASFSNALRTVSGTTSTTVGGEGMPSWLAALLAALKPATPVTPTVSLACQNLSAKLVGAQYGAKSSQNVQLQGFLLSEGESIPALAAGAAFGLYLDQTQAAINHFRASHNCL